MISGSPAELEQSGQTLMWFDAFGSSSAAIMLAASNQPIRIAMMPWRVVGVAVVADPLAVPVGTVEP